MSSGLQDPVIMDETLFSSEAFSEKDLCVAEALQSNDYNDFKEDENSTENKTNFDAGQNNAGEENFDFAENIIDLLLCVQNDAHARQNIESIMDHWDEMNLLGDENSKSFLSSETNIQTKVNTTSDLMITPKDNGNDPEVTLNCPETECEAAPGLQSDDSDPAVPNLSQSADHNTAATEFSSVTLNDPQQSSTLKPSPSSPALIKCEPLTSSAPNKSSSAALHKAANDLLNEKIRQLFCARCRRTYEELMACGSIVKIPCKPYACPFCRGNYYHQSSANIHMKVHMEEEALTCRLCVVNDRALKRNRDRENELNLRKRIRLNTFPCLICSAVLDNRVQLEEHILDHKNRINMKNKKTLPVLIEKEIVTTAGETILYTNRAMGSSDQNRSHIKRVVKAVNSSESDHNYGKSTIPVDDLKFKNNNESALGDGDRKKFAQIDVTINDSTAKSKEGDIPSLSNGAPPTLKAEETQKPNQLFSTSSQINIFSPNSSEDATNFVYDSSTNLPFNNTTDYFLEDSSFPTETNGTTSDSVQRNSNSCYTLLNTDKKQLPEFNMTTDVFSQFMQSNVNSNASNVNYSEIIQELISNSPSSNIVTSPLMVSPKTTLVKTSGGANFHIINQTRATNNEGLATNSSLSSQGKSYLIMYTLPSTTDSSPSSSSNEQVTERSPQKIPPVTSYTSPATNEITTSNTKFLLSINSNGQQSSSPSPQLLSILGKNSKLPVAIKNGFVQKPKSKQNRTQKNGHSKAPPRAQGKRNILQIAYDNACNLIEPRKTENKPVAAAQVSPPITSTENSPTGNYTVLKQILSAKPRLSPTNSTEGETPPSQPPVPISFTDRQVTFQYLNNEDQDEKLVPISQKPQQVKCEVCRQLFSTDQLMAHLKTHSKTVYKCTYCQEIFVLQSSLIEHMRKHVQQPRIFNCHLCSKSFTNALLFRLHLLVHKGLLFICVTCVKLFSKKEEYENHLKTHDQLSSALHQCSKCARDFTPPLPISAGSESICSECKINPPAEEAKQAHLNDQPATMEKTTEFEDLCFKCPYCDVVCNGGVEFKNHLAFHITTKQLQQIKCIACNEIFDKFASLAEHVEKQHNLIRNFFCHYCSKIITDRKSYQNDTHPNSKPYSCMVCEQSLFNQTDLTVPR